MYYMLNQERQIVAADYELLDILEINSLPILFSKVVNNDIKITKVSDRKLTIISNISTIQSAFEEYTIKTTFGDIILVKLYNTVSKSTSDRTSTPIKSINKPNILLDDEVEKPKKKIPTIFFDDDDVIQKPIKKESIIEEKEEKTQLEKDLEEASQELHTPKIKTHELEESIETINSSTDILTLDETQEEDNDDSSNLFLDAEDDKPLLVDEKIVEEESSELFLEVEEPVIEEKIVEESKEVDDLLLDLSEAEPEELVIEEKKVEKEVEEIDDLLLDLSEAEPKKVEKKVEKEVEEIDDLLLDLSEAEPKKEEEKVEEEEVEEIDDLLLDLSEAEPKKVEEKVEEEEVEEIDDLLLDLSEAEPKKVEEKVEEEEVEEIDDLLLDLSEAEPKKVEEKVEEEEVKEIDDLFLELEDITPPAKEEPKESVEEIKDLLLDIEEKPSLKEESKRVEKKPIKDYNCDDTIEINIDERSEDMGISASDYQDFLNEFIDKSIAYDEDLRSEDKTTREDVLEELQSIAESLEIENLEEILVDMQERDYLEEELVDIFFECLGQITTVSNDKPQEEEKVVEEIKEEPKTEIKEEPKEESKGFGTLELDGIKPIHFDFRLEEAADDLSLPVDLIEEFVNDFVDQAVEEKETFIKAFADGDIDTIQKTGHKLKGASSNLRIIPLSETLEEIQHCENPARFEPLLKKYWGQFLSFKLFMENIAH